MQMQEMQEMQESFAGCEEGSLSGWMDAQPVDATVEEAGKQGQDEARARVVWWSGLLRISNRA